MPSPKVRGNYEQLGQIAQKFTAEQDRAQQTMRQIRQQMDVLRGGDWIGQGARRFYSEMDSDVLPSLTRLVQAMGEASKVTKQISEIIKTAEADASRILDKEPGQGGNDSGGAGGSNSGAGGGDGSGGGSNSGPGSGGGSGNSGGSGSNQPAPDGKTVRDVKDLYTDQNLKSLIGKEWQGANSDKLADGMRSLYENRGKPVDSPEVQAALKQISEARGVPMDKLQQDYQKYQAVREAEIARTGKEPKPLDEQRFPEFMGSTSQMRFGQVVGDAFGVDPVFGAMLSPTGGLVGPDNHAVDGDDSALGYHGAVHDAAGYLYNSHGVGPGYDYRGSDIQPTSWPTSGQVGGVRYWQGQLGEGTGSVLKDVGGGLWEVGKYEAGQAVDAAKDWWNSSGPGSWF